MGARYNAGPNPGFTPARDDYVSCFYSTYRLGRFAITQRAAFAALCVIR